MGDRAKKHSRILQDGYFLRACSRREFRRSAENDSLTKSSVLRPPRNRSYRSDDFRYRRSHFVFRISGPFLSLLSSALYHDAVYLSRYSVRKCSCTVKKQQQYRQQGQPLRCRRPVHNFILSETHLRKTVDRIQYSKPTTLLHCYDYLLPIPFPMTE